jgi:uncharacterized protein YceH (UPF0502 family)
MELSAQEIRVLGCLVEKEATTPDNYPLSTNALTAACNQSTNRDPVVQYRDSEVDALMLQLREQKLARTVRGDGQRVHKHKHVLGEAWGLDRAQLAVLSLLMLRGAQTAAELRARAERYGVEPVAADAALASLGEGDRPLVVRLERRPGERESRWAHLLGDAAAAEPPVAAPGAPSAEPRPRPAPAPDGDQVRRLEAQVERLAATLEDVVARLGALERELGLDASDGAASGSGSPDQNR